MTQIDSTLMFEGTWPPGFCSIFLFLYSIWLRSGFISESIRGDVYAAVCLTQAHFLLSACSKSFLPGTN